MIRINKSPPPEILTTSGAELRAEHCRLFEEKQDDYLSGKKRFKFQRSIYSRRTVKNTLREDQHKKCCYCEGKFEQSSSADIEHYRPKGAVRQDEDEPMLYPGYYWLAYCWENLYYCCQQCNRSSKKELFPLRNPADRARSHADDVGIEQPLIIDPGGIDNPRNHIEYRGHFAHGKTEIGRTTVDVVKLNREDLLEYRLKRLENLSALQTVIRLTDSSPDPNDIEDRAKAIRKLALAIEETAEFSAMAIDYLHRR